MQAKITCSRVLGLAEPATFSLNLPGDSGSESQWLLESSPKIEH